MYPEKNEKKKKLKQTNASAHALNSAQVQDP